MGPRTEEIEAHRSRIETLLDEWGYGAGAPALRAQKLAQVISWLENFRPSEIADAVLLLSKIQYKQDQVIRAAVERLSAELRRLLGDALSSTRFFPLGTSPSSSGGMYLYDFRKFLELGEDSFPATNFSDSVDKASSLVFFDDIIGSGNQAIKFYGEHLAGIKIPVHYVAVFAFERGLSAVRKSSGFRSVMAGVNISDEERAFHEETQVFQDPLVRQRLRALAHRYGEELYPTGPLGYDQSQSLIVFPHNAPNNTLPIFWAGPANEKAPGIIWNPVWERRKRIEKAQPPSELDLSDYLEQTAEEFSRWQKRYVRIIGTERIVEVPLYAHEVEQPRLGGTHEDFEPRKGDIRSLRDTVRERQMILLADAGRGKTTTLQFLAQEDARSVIQGDPQAAIPVYLEMKSIWGDHSLEYLVFQRIGLGAAITESLLTDGRINLYLDGLNEVAGEIRQRVISSLPVLFRKYPNARVIMTGRPQLYSEYVAGIPVFHLEPFSPAQMQEFLVSNAPRDTAQHIWDYVEAHPRVRQVVSAPLLLLMLVNIYSRRQPIPESEADIVKLFMDGLLVRETETDVSFDPILYRLLLRDVALGALRAKGACTSFSLAEAIALVEEAKARCGTMIDPLAFWRKASELGIVAIEGDTYSFSHPTYQEFFAAEQIVSRWQSG